MKVLLSFLAMLCASKGYRSSISKVLSSSTLYTSSYSSREVCKIRLPEFRKSSMMSMSTEAAGGYLSVHVKGLITPGRASSDTFYRNSLHNAKNSVLESGISRFDVLNNIDNNDEFLLVEVYNSQTGPADHKLTPHYNSWRENVADLMAQPRTAAKYTTLFPPRSNWKTDASASIIEEDSHMKNIPWNQKPFISESGELLSCKESHVRRNACVHLCRS